VVKRLKGKTAAQPTGAETVEPRLETPELHLWIPPHLLARYLPPVPSWFLTKDGYWLYSRLIRADDAPRLIEFFDRLSSETRRRRFNANVDHLDLDLKLQHARTLAGVDNGPQGGAVIAVDHQRGQQVIVGVIRLGPVENGLAEVAVVIRDDFQGRGVGYALLQRLLPLARRMGVHTVYASVQADNLAALRLFRRLDYPVTGHTTHGETILQIRLPIVLTSVADPI
jgi:RimJ/RimL family protein N-acetyltransferase